MREYQRTRRATRISVTSGLVMGAIGIGLLLEQTTAGQRLLAQVVILLAGVAVAGVAWRRDVHVLGAVLPFVYGAGWATLGLVTYGHAGIRWMVLATTAAAGALVFRATIIRFEAPVVSAVAGVVGAAVTGVILNAV